MENDQIQNLIPNMDEDHHLVKNVRPVRLKDKAQRKNFTIEQ